MASELNSDFQFVLDSAGKAVQVEWDRFSESIVANSSSRGQCAEEAFVYVKKSICDALAFHPIESPPFRNDGGVPNGSIAAEKAASCILHFFQEESEADLQDVMEAVLGAFEEEMKNVRPLSPAEHPLRACIFLSIFSNYVSQRTNGNCIMT